MSRATLALRAPASSSNAGAFRLKSLDFTHLACHLVSMPSLSCTTLLEDVRDSVHESSWVRDSDSVTFLPVDGQRKVFPEHGLVTLKVSSVSAGSSSGNTRR